MALCLNLIGFYSLVGYANVLTPQGSAGSIVVRLVILLVTFVVLAKNAHRIRFGFGVAFAPVFAFFLIYTFRLLENIFFLDMYWPPGPYFILTVFFANGIIMALVIALVTPLARDRDFYYSMRFLCVLFVLALVANYDALAQTFDYRVSLEKINPISMGHTAFAFAIFFLMHLIVTGRRPVLTVILLPIMVFIVVYARSRGAYLAGALALVIFFLTRLNSKRVWIVGILVVIALALNEELVNTAIERMLMTEKSDQSTWERLIAYRGAWEQFLADPIFGRYAIERTTNFYPHNIYLEVLMSVGLLGAIPFFLHVMIAVRGAIGLLADRETPLVAVFVALYFLREATAAMFSGSLYGHSGFWMASISTIVLWLNRRKLPERGLRAKAHGEPGPQAPAAAPARRSMWRNPRAGNVR